MVVLFTVLTVLRGEEEEGEEEREKEGEGNRRPESATKIRKLAEAFMKSCDIRAAGGAELHETFIEN